MSTDHRCFNQARWAFAAFLAIASLLGAGLHASPAHALPVPQPTISGWLTVLWGDSSGEHGASQTVYQFTADSGNSTVLQIDDSLARSLGGMLPFDRKHVIVTTDSAVGLSAQGLPSSVHVTSLLLDPIQDSGQAGSLGVQEVTGSQPWISILCKFSDYADQPHNLAFFQDMYVNAWPGVDHYWREQSYNTINVLGSNAVGWFTLPHPRSYYVYDADADGEEELSFDRTGSDCTAAADASVNFTQFVGINMMFNANLDCCAWGGGGYFTLDGESKVWNATWLPPWGYADLSPLEHEMGHGFGMPHSSGNYDQTYDNAWDVMSNAWYGCGIANDPTYGCLGQGTISYHKDLLGWIPAPQKFMFAGGTSTITLEQLALPATSNYRMAQIPISGSSTHFYTVEARRLVGYDVKLPGSAVVIHEVDTTRGNRAHVIDVDNDGDTSDGGAMWLPGETFTDAAIGLTVHIDSAAATGYVVTITRTGPLFLSGYVLTSGGAGIPGVVMGGLPGSPVTDDQGFYSVNITSGASPTVTPSKSGCTFTPPNRPYASITTDRTGENYTGSCASDVRLVGVYTGDGSWAEKTAFTAGDPIQYIPHIVNDRNTAQNADLLIEVTDPNDVVVFGWDGTITTAPGEWWWGFDDTVGYQTAGTFTFTCWLTYQGATTSASTTYTVTVPPPGAFNKTGPSNGAGSSLTPTLQWGASPHATSYEYCYDKTSDNACSPWIDRGSLTSVTLPTLDSGATYYWQVRAVNGGGSTYANGSSAAFWSFTANPALTLTTRSVGKQDGWVLESAENSNIGGPTMAASPTFNLGDDNYKRQFRGILSFNITSAMLPPDAVIASVTLQIRKAAPPQGSDPFNTLGVITVDIKKGAFRGNTALQSTDFQAAATKANVITIPNTPVGSWYTGVMSPEYFGYINRLGVTQLRLRFTTDDNNNRIADYLRFYAGDFRMILSRPKLIIQYYVP